MINLQYVIKTHHIVYIYTFFSLSIAPDKAPFQLKNTDLFLIFPQKHMLWYTLEVPYQVASNEYPQHMILWRNKKK